jgi:hypothetical protein
VKLAHIVPGRLLEDVFHDMPQEDYHLVLASQILSNTKYLAFYQQRIGAGDYVILDNDAYEQQGVSSPIGVILECLEVLHPAEIVLPDIMDGPNCAKETIRESTIGAAYIYEAMRPGKPTPAFTAVPHGNSIQEWIRCAQELASIEGVKCLGIAEKDALKLTGGDRKVLIQAIIGLKKDIHLFGMMENMKDIRDPWVQGAVRGCDGSKCVVWGLNHTMAFLNSVPSYPGRPADFFDITGMEVDKQQLAAMRYNIKAWSAHCRRYGAGS